MDIASQIHNIYQDINLVYDEFTLENGMQTASIPILQSYTHKLYKLHILFLKVYKSMIHNKDECIYTYRQCVSYKNKLSNTLINIRNYPIHSNAVTSYKNTLMYDFFMNGYDRFEELAIMFQSI